MSTNEPPPPPPPDDYGSVPPPPPPPPPSYGGYGATPPPGPSAPPGGAGEYNVGTAFTYGWNKFTANIGQIAIAVIVLVAALIAIQVVGALFSQGRFLLQFGFSLISWIVSMIIGAGIVRGALAIT